MSNLCIVVNEKRCINCHACEVHCQVWNETSPVVKPGRMLFSPPHTDQHSATTGRPSMRTAFLSCMHCNNPPCVRVCPTEAMRRRASDGIVYVETGLCVGCRACVMACPWRVPQWCPQGEHIVKCDMCRQRLDNGLKPACVTGCTTKALTFSDDPAVAEKERLRREKALNRAAVRGDD